MRSLILILLFALLVISQINTIVDIDLWCHFKAGEYTLKNFSIPDKDIFSYTLAGQDWIHYDWLSEVIFYGIFTHFGWPGLNILKALIIALCFFIFYLSFPRKGKLSYFLAFALLAILAFDYRSFLRPELFSFLLLAVFFYILEKRRAVYLLPFLEILWVNLHGYFLMGLIIIFLYIIGDLSAGNINGAKRLGKVFILAILACLINPYFYKGFLYPLKFIGEMVSGKRLFLQDISELMMPIRAEFKKFVFYWALACLASVTFLLNLKKARLSHVLIFSMSFAASYLAFRYLPVFVFFAMPIAALNLNEATLTKDINDRRYYGFFILIICALMYLFVSDRYYELTKQFEFKKTESRFSRLLIPSGACDFLARNNIGGRIFNTLDFGHYIAYRFYPERRIFIDARVGLYSQNFYELYRRAQNYPGEWEEVQKRYNFDIALIRHLFGGTERLLRYLYSSDKWALVYYDENSAVFLHDVPTNKNTIERFRVDFIKQRLENKEYNIRIARFFEKIGERKSAEEIYLQLLRSDPEYLEAGNNLAAIYISETRFNEALVLIDRLLKYHPKSAELYANIGAAYLQMARKEEGILMLEKSARLNPYLRQASYMLGLVYLERGNTDKALQQFKKFVDLDPYNPGVRRILGDIYTRKGLLKQAEFEYNEADKLEGK